MASYCSLASSVRGASSMPCCVSSAAMSVSRNQIGISIATVTLSFASMNRCSVSCRNLLLPTAGMMRAAVWVAALCFRLTTVRDASAHVWRACDARALGRPRDETGHAGKSWGCYRGNRRASANRAVACAFVVERAAARRSSLGRW